MLQHWMEPFGPPSRMQDRGHGSRKIRDIHPNKLSETLRGKPTYELSLNVFVAEF
jgi:hypothetical protein